MADRIPPDDVKEFIDSLKEKNIDFIDFMDSYEDLINLSQDERLHIIMYYSGLIR